MVVKDSQPNYLSEHLLLDAPNNRHGISLCPQPATKSFSDIDTIIHMGAPTSVKSEWDSASGGVGWDEKSARLAATGESIERYCAGIIKLPLKSKNDINKNKMIDAENWCLFTDKQRQMVNFPFGNIYSDKCLFTNVYNFQDNTEMWVPSPFVTLRDDYKTGISTSSGLAAGPTAKHALLRGIQELIERDALMYTWMHSVQARSLKIPEKYQKSVDKLSGEIWAFDITPDYSPFPVIAVAGGIMKRGKWRYSLGLACRETWTAALDKAFLEWNQGVLFAGIYEKYVDTSNILNSGQINTFDEHAVFYSLHPEYWYDLPMFKNRNKIFDVSKKGRKMSTDQALLAIKNSLQKNNIRLYYRDLTTIDAYQLGIRVVRATSPDLAPIFAHQTWPLIGKMKDRLYSRYDWAPKNLNFPNLMPHPLG